MIFGAIAFDMARMRSGVPSSSKEVHWVVLDRAFGHVDGLADLAVRIAAGEQTQDVDLAKRTTKRK